LGTNRGVAVLADKVFMVTDNAHLIALNRTTGHLMWEVVLPDEPQHYGSTVAPSSSRIWSLQACPAVTGVFADSSLPTGLRPANVRGGSGQFQEKENRGMKPGGAKNTRLAAAQHG